MTVDTLESALPSSHADPASSEREIVIEARSGWSPLNLRDLWAYRGLFYFLCWRDIKVRYKQTVLGASWAIIQPVMTAIIFTAFFGQRGNMPSDGLPYLIFTYSGLVLWTFFAYAMSQASNSLVNSANLVSKVYFPRLIVPIASALAGIVDFCMAFLVLIAMMVYFRVSPTPALALAPVFVFFALTIALAAGFWLSALNVQYRDVRYVVPFLTQIGLFASPVIYAGNYTSGKTHVLLALNPMTGAIEGFRWAVLGQNHVDTLAISMSIVITAVRGRGVGHDRLCCPRRGAWQEVQAGCDCGAVSHAPGLYRKSGWSAMEVRRESSAT
jgi:lipopolysaccharide transport system permease protein